MNEFLFQSIAEKRISFLFRNAIDCLVREELARTNPAVAFSAELALLKERKAAEEKIAEQLKGSAYETLFERFPLLRESYAVVSEQLKVMQSEFEQRITRDADAISRTFFHGKAFGNILELSGDGADVHNHGRMTLKVVCEGGTFFYKPHCCAVDVVLRKLCETLFARHIEVPVCLDMGPYGYCACIENKPALGLKETKQFYFNIGVLCALAASVGIQDLHCENILASGAVPVLIDLETALPLRIDVMQNSALQNEFTNALQNSLYTSALLPYFSGSGKYSVMASTDANNPSAPYIGLKKQSGADYQPDILKGFSYGYRICSRNRQTIKTILMPLKDIPIRFLLRNTNDYMRMLNALNTADALRGPDSRQRIINGLRSGLTSDQCTRLREILYAEQNTLAEQNVPYFYTYGASHDIYCDGKVTVRGAFSKSALEMAVTRLDALSDCEKQFEENIIKTSFQFLSVPIPAVEPEKQSDAAPLKRQDTQAIAREILLDLYNRSFLSPSGARGIFALRSDIGKNGGLLCDLASGTSGIGVFAAAYRYLYPYERETLRASDALIGLAIDNLKSFVKYCRNTDSVPVEEITIGLAAGYAGILRALMLLKRYTGDSLVSELWEQLLSLADRIPLEQIDFCDVYSGLSGLLLVLGNSEHANKIPPHFFSAAAERLLQLQNNIYKDHRLWKTLPNTPRVLSGYGHGMAGIGLSLLRAFRLSGSERYLRAAADAYAFEHEVYSEKLGTWPDFRKNPLSERYMHGICSGAPGIAIALNDAADSPMKYAADDLEMARNALLTLPLQYRDTLCCGKAAVAEALITLHDTEEAAKVAGDIASAYRANHHFRLGRSGFSPMPVPDLFFGTSGIGYTLLRLAAPDKILSLFL